MHLLFSNPFGIAPSGNSFGDSERDVRDSSLGDLAVFPDDVLLSIFEAVGPVSLSVLAPTSRYFYVFSRHPPLWRTFTAEEFGSSGFEYRSTWRDTYASEAAKRAGRPEPKLGVPLACEGVFSDLLFQHWLCSAISVPAAWMARDTLPRVAASELPLEDFIERFERPNRPCIITGLVEKWPAMASWTCEALAKDAGPTLFRCGAVDFTLSQFWSYQSQAKEEAPLILFDKNFCRNLPHLAADFEVPEYFREDLFGLLGEAKRPEYRWLIAGPERSGSFFHIDPNGTSAWNAVLKGHKKWIMIPPGRPPPGVFPSGDGAEVIVPISLIEWFINNYSDLAGSGALEGVCGPGELVFVPSGWWHCVLNLDDTLAITQNYVSRRNLPVVLDFLENRTSQISGYAGDPTRLGPDLREAFERAFPGQLTEIMSQSENAKKRKRGKWEELTQDKTGFSFGFNVEEEEGGDSGE
jgi:hypothetical protein